MMSKLEREAFFATHKAAVELAAVIVDLTKMMQRLNDRVLKLEKLAVKGQL